MIVLAVVGKLLAVAFFTALVASLLACFFSVRHRENWYKFLAGFRWAFTKQIVWDDLHHKYRDRSGSNYRVGKYGKLPRWEMIEYEPGWGPWRFVLTLYWWDHGLATVFGCGVVPLSTFWYARAQKGKPFSRRMTRLLDRVLPGDTHGALCGPRLWGSHDLWEGI